MFFMKLLEGAPKPPVIDIQNHSPLLLFIQNIVRKKEARHLLSPCSFPSSSGTAAAATVNPDPPGRRRWWPPLSSKMDSIEDDLPFNLDIVK